MGLAQWWHDRNKDLAYAKHTAKIKGRLKELDALEEAQEKARGRKLKVLEPDLPDFPAEYDRDLTLPDLWVCTPEREFSWSFNTQDCLTRLGGWIAKWTDPVSGQSAAQSIATSAYIYGVNPRLLVASLQREKGLIRTKTAPEQKDLDWAAGVGAYDGRPWDEKYKGFGRQVRSMAATYRNRFDEYEEGKSLRINFPPFRRMATPKNAGTWALLKYTPHDSASLLTYKIMRFFFSK